MCVLLLSCACALIGWSVLVLGFHIYCHCGVPKSDTGNVILL